MRPPISCPRTVNCTNESVVIALHHMHDDSCRPVRPAPRQNCSRAQHTFGAPSFCLLSPVFGHIRQPTDKSRNLYQNQRNYNIACAACQRTIRRRCWLCKVSDPPHLHSRHVSARRFTHVKKLLRRRRAHIYAFSAIRRPDHAL